MIARSIAFFKNIALGNTSPHQLAFAIALGTYIAFSPFLGLHTIMLVGAGWLFNLNIPFMVAVGYGINNPWTMLPIYMGGYFFGYWLLHGICAIPLAGLNPTWMVWFNQKIMTYLEIKEISFWAFMLGGNVLGVIFGLIAYPAALMICKRVQRNQS